MVADPLHKLEIVMPCHGGAAVVIASQDTARRAKNRPVWVKGFGERVTFKTPTYAADLLRSPISAAADRAFEMASIDRGSVDMASIYDCYTITVLMSLEDAGFCEKGKGIEFVNSRDLTFRGDFPLNTAGGQLSLGRAGDAQVRDCNTAFVSGNGGIMSEQVALVLQGD
jgi:acetyl-CoA acetyltransferase